LCDIKSMYKKIDNIKSKDEMCSNNLREARDKMVKLIEVKISVSTAIAAAFGFIIALIWKEIIVGLFALAGLTINDITDVTGAVIAIISGVIITLVCVFGILYISKWGGIGQK